MPSKVFSGYASSSGTHCATPGATGILPSGCLATTVVPGVPMLYFGGFAASLALVQTIGPIS